MSDGKRQAWWANLMRMTHQGRDMGGDRSCIYPCAYTIKRTGINPALILPPPRLPAAETYCTSLASNCRIRRRVINKHQLAACLLVLYLIVWYGNDPVAGASESASHLNNFTQTDAPGKRASGKTRKADDVITPERIGPVRLGMTVQELKRLFPGANYRIVTLPDIASIVAIRQGPRDLFYFTTSSNSGKLPAPKEIINFLITKNPRYRTEAGVKPGSLLADAVKVYGAPELYYSPDAEYAKFSRAPASKMGFMVVGPPGQDSAGIYRMSPENIEGGYYRSTRFRPGSMISYVSIASEEVSEERAAEAEKEAVAEVFRPALAQIQSKTQVPVLLPSALPETLAGRKIYAGGTGSADGYSITLTSAPDCGANACFIGSFEAKRGGKPAFKRSVNLAEGIKGHYKPLTCGGSCSPPVIEWVYQGVLYSIQLDVAGAGHLSPVEEERLITQTANSAIKAGPRSTVH